MQNAMIVAVKGIIIQDNKVLLVQRSQQDAFLAGCWEFPGGKMEFGETLEQALAREVMEETGLTVTQSKLLYASSFATKPTVQLTLLTYFAKTNLGDVKISFEHQNYMWATKEEMLTMINPEVTTQLVAQNIIDLLFST